MAVDEARRNGSFLMQGLSTGAERSKEQDATQETVPTDPRESVLLQKESQELVVWQHSGIAKLPHCL